MSLPWSPPPPPKRKAPNTITNLSFRVWYSNFLLQWKISRSLKLIIADVNNECYWPCTKHYVFMLWFLKYKYTMSRQLELSSKVYNCKHMKSLFYLFVPEFGHRVQTSPPLQFAIRRIHQQLLQFYVSPVLPHKSACSQTFFLFEVILQEKYVYRFVRACYTSCSSVTHPNTPSVGSVIYKILTIFSSRGLQRASV
jgi:hypothetical protein